MVCVLSLMALKTSGPIPAYENFGDFTLTNSPQRVSRIMHSGTSSSADPLSYLRRSDDVGRLLLVRDWNTHALGPVDKWPEQLHELLRLCCHSNFPYILYWGADLLTFWNSAAAPFFHAHHPNDLGKPLHEIKPDAMRVLNAPLEQVMATGRPVLFEDLQLIYRRHDYEEELYETFSYSPVFDAAGRVQAILTPVFDTTSHVIGSRRLNTLGEVGTQTRGTFVTAVLHGTRALPCAQSVRPTVRRAVHRRGEGLVATDDVRWPEGRYAARDRRRVSARASESRETVASAQTDACVGYEDHRGRSRGRVGRRAARRRDGAGARADRAIAGRASGSGHQSLQARRRRRRST